MNDDIYLMPLGGGDHVGASCYFLRLGTTNILLDAGNGIENGILYEPNMYALQTLPFLYSMNQIDHIFISHAHTDHIGYLPKLMTVANHASIYMTELTSVFAQYRCLAMQQLFDRITKVSYMQTLDFGMFKVTFLPAGHIPGAMMMLFEYGKRRILYTGDYSLEGTALTNGCYIPEGVDVDTIILCGLHAKHPNYKKKENRLYDSIQMMLQEVRKGHSITCSIPQLSKGIEFLKILNEANTDHIPIYMDSSLRRLIEKLEQLGIPLLTKDNYFTYRSSPHIYITSKKKQGCSIDFSLHEDFAEMKALIQRLNPKYVYVVHCGKEQSPLDDTIEQVMIRDGECRTQFTFAQDCELYRI